MVRRRKIDQAEVERILAEFAEQAEALLAGVGDAERKELCEQVARELLAEAGEGSEFAPQSPTGKFQRR